MYMAKDNALKEQYHQKPYDQKIFWLPLKEKFIWQAHFHETYLYGWQS
jgi:hypothetical protein